MIGLDPGPTTGYAEMHWDDLGSGLVRVDLVMQLAADDVPDALRARVLLVREMPRVIIGLAVEDFVIGTVSRAGRHDGAVARRVIAQALAVPGVEWRCARAAGHVKPWATDRRIEALPGALLATKGLPHARDALRHSLFALARDFGMPDPLSVACVRVNRRGR